MSRARSPHFESLETRELLSGVHADKAHAHKAHAAQSEAASLAATTPASISGTLTLNNKDASQGQNAYGGYTTSVPVSGTLSGLGQVSGYWYESTDEMGDYMGPDTITLHGASGAISVAFSDGAPGPAHKSGPHSIYYQHKLVIEGGTGDFAGETGSGTINLNMNGAHTMVKTITISAQDNPVST